MRLGKPPKGFANWSLRLLAEKGFASRIGFVPANGLFVPGRVRFTTRKPIREAKLGIGANHASDVSDGSARQQWLDRIEDVRNEPASLAEWTEFHEQVGALPEAEREVVHLLLYQGLDQAEAASVLGVSVRTVKRRWRSARLLLYQALHGEPLPQEC